jgi:3-hydroxyisobutyrate dehydrogenase-like beta-hydroxyacid dehydrogenase
MCKNLVQKGALANPLLLYNRTVSRATELSAQIGHSTVCTSIGEAVSEADIIFLCLGDDGAVKNTIAEAISGDVRGKLFVDCSTVHPDTTSAVASMVEDRGAYFVACPVFGAPPMADAGQLVCVLAGAAEQVQKVRPYCQGVMGRAVIDFSGSAPSKATLLKVIGNTFVLSMIETIAEGHVVAEKTGLGVDNLHQFIEIMFPGPYTTYSNRMRSGDYYQRNEPLFSVNLALKDAGHALDLANKAGVQMRNVMLADEYLTKVLEQMDEKGDIADIYGAKRLEAGLSFGNQESNVRT